MAYSLLKFKKNTFKIWLAISKLNKIEKKGCFGVFVEFRFSCPRDTGNAGMNSESARRTVR